MNSIIDFYIEIYRLIFTSIGKFICLPALLFDDPMIYGEFLKAFWIIVTFVGLYLAVAIGSKR